MLALNQIPNILTILRIVLIAPFALAVYDGNYSLALIIFFVAGLSDGIDGFLARQFNWKSRFGAIADPLADKLLLVTAYVMLAWVEQIPFLLMIAVLARDLVILCGALIYHYFISHYEISPSWLGKTCTMTQIVYVLGVVVELAGFPMVEWLDSYGHWVVALITILSGVHYLLVWSMRGWHELKGRSNGRV